MRTPSNIAPLRLVHAYDGSEARDRLRSTAEAYVEAFEACVAAFLEGESCGAYRIEPALRP